MLTTNLNIGPHSPISREFAFKTILRLDIRAPKCFNSAAIASSPGPKTLRSYFRNFFVHLRAFPNISEDISTLMKA